MNRRLLLLLLPLAACAEGVGFTTVPTPTEQVALPPGSVQGAGDPTRAAVIRSASAFENPGVLMARPGAAARSIADMEFLAIALLQDPRYSARGGLLPGQLVQAKTEWRNALGIPANAPAQPIINAFYQSWAATQRGDRAAAIAALPGGQAQFTRLSSLGALPATSQAANTANQVQSQVGDTPGRGIR